MRVDSTSQPGRPQPAQQVRLRVEVERRLAERRADLVGERLELGRSPAAAGRGPEQLGQQRVVRLDAPRHPVVLHLGGDERARRLGGEQQAQAARARRRPRPRRAGAAARSERVGGLPSGSDVVEQAALDRWRRLARGPSHGPGSARAASADACAVRRSGAGSRGRAAGRGSARRGRRRPAAAGSGGRCRPRPSAGGRPRARGRPRRGRRRRRSRSPSGSPSSVSDLQLDDAGARRVVDEQQQGHGSWSQAGPTVPVRRHRCARARAEEVGGDP